MPQLDLTEEEAVLLKVGRLICSPPEVFLDYTTLKERDAMINGLIVRVRIWPNLFATPLLCP